MPNITRNINEVLISVDKGIVETRRLVNFSARNVVTGRMQSELSLYGDESELFELVDRLKKRIEEAFRDS